VPSSHFDHLLTRPKFLKPNARRTVFASEVALDYEISKLTTHQSSESEDDPPS